MFGKWTVFVGVILVVGIGLLVLDVYLPSKPGRPYVGMGTYRISPVEWEFGEFAPVYLWKFEKNGGSYIKTAYRDERGLVRLKDIFVGGELDDLVFENVKISGDESKMGFGRRIVVEYFTGVPGGWETPEVTEFCKKMSRICGIAKAGFQFGKGPVVALYIKL